MREYLADNNLTRYIAIMLDEAHGKLPHTFIHTYIQLNHTLMDIYYIHCIPCIVYYAML